MKTKRGIYKDLEESHYQLKYLGNIFYFSSLFYKSKFINDVESFVYTKAKQYKMFFSDDEDMRNFLVILCYSKIEKRGFLIKIDDNFYDKFEYKINYNLIGVGYDTLEEE